MKRWARISALFTQASHQSPSMPFDRQRTSFRIGILGAGLGGIGAAIRLKQAGIDDFVILEKSEHLGGTWRDNTYPGCACDVPSAFYSYSFAPKPDWSRMFAEQAEIRRYIEETATRFGIREHIMFGTEAKSSRWDDARQRWIVETTAGTYDSQVVISAAGPWHEPVLPDVPGLRDFPGEVFHSSRWNHGYDFDGRRVAVIGSGASAVQFVPEIQPRVAKLHLYQRTPHWILPKGDRPFTEFEKWLFKHVPLMQKLLRAMIFLLTEAFGYAQRHPSLIGPVQRIAESYLARVVKDPALRAILTPNFMLGCKRTLFSNNWYQALQQPNVEVLPTALVEVRGNVIVGADGSKREVDAIILATGFSVTDLPAAHHTHGVDGRTLDEVWNGSPQAYLGSTVTGFPNLFMLLGPNSGNGHGSALFLHESQINYALDGIRQLERRGATSFDVKPEVQHTFNLELQDKLQHSVWNAGGCASYYQDRNGKNAAMFPWSTITFRRRTRRFNAKSYRFQVPAGG
jgi:cation diffusion facilitator CzcD-associated flavoprotein CzcO